MKNRIIKFCVLFIVLFTLIVFVLLIQRDKSLSIFNGSEERFNSGTTSSYDDVINALQEISYSFYMRGNNLQYNSKKGAWIQPEEATSQNTNYLNCSIFIRNVYNELLNEKINMSTTSLLQYAKVHNDTGSSHEEHPEVIAYGKKNGTKVEMTFYNNGSQVGYKANVTLDDIIPYLQVGDILTYTGHTMIVYKEHINSETHQKDNVYVIQSSHGNSNNYIQSKIPSSISIQDNSLTGDNCTKEGEIRFGTANDYLWYNDYDNTRNYSEGIANEGTLTLGLLTQESYWKNSDLAGGNLKDEYSILRFINKDENNNATYNIDASTSTDSILKRKDDASAVYLSDKTKTRLDYKKLFIEKTVDTHADDVVEVGDELTYKIIVRNSNKATVHYNKDIVVTENLSPYVSYISNKVYKNNVVTSDISCVENSQDKNLSWNIGKLQKGDEIIIEYKVKVNNDSLGKIIESEGTVNNIPIKVKNFVGNNLTINTENIIKESYESLKNGEYEGKEFIDKIYESAGIELGLAELDVKDLIINDNEIKNDSGEITQIGQSYVSSKIHLNQNNKFYNTILNNYWNMQTSKPFNYNNMGFRYNILHKWRDYDNPDRRADTINSENFRTGDILIYQNNNDTQYKYANNTINKTTVTYERGEYVYIYIEGKGFVGINYGTDREEPRFSRNEFNANYYKNFKNNYPSSSILSIYKENIYDSNAEMLEYGNYQTLFGKNYYVILRPSLGFDVTPPEVSVAYSTTSLTNQDVTVTITANEKIQDLSGWTKSSDGKSLTKVYKKNINENFTIKDLAENEKLVNIKIVNIVNGEKGDLNENNQIDIGDILLLYRHIAQKNSTETAQKHPDWNLSENKVFLGDLNNNNQIDIGDCLRIQRYISASNSEEVAIKHPEWLSSF